MPLAQTAIFCADIGGSFIDFALIGPDGRIGMRQKCRTPTRDLDAFTKILMTLTDHQPHIPLHIALPGLRDPQKGICTTANIPCVNGIDLAKILGERLNRNVKIGNDADCFTLAETLHGAARGHRNVLGIILGTGVGGGLVLGGELVVGAGGLTGEWGHAPFIPSIPGTEDKIPCFPCGCGQRGCIDTIGGARGLERLHAWSCKETADSRTILTAWHAGDEKACQTLAIYLHYLSSALALAINITGATILPAGGGLANDEKMLAALDAAVREKILRPTENPLIVASQLGNAAGLIGAAAL
ncbi:ROK family protein (plasmid) [Kozakia baliensis]|uniref:ROK family protein n=1 Tax=Kozakia baliensis TaxID=153496 RepID=UPI00345B6018